MTRKRRRCRDRPDDPAWDWRRTYCAIALPRTAPWGETIHLRVERRDGRDGIGWETLQRIKDDMLGPEVLAVEFYPEATNVVNEQNMRHLWTVPREILPIGLGQVWQDAAEKRGRGRCNPFTCGSALT